MATPAQTPTPSGFDPKKLGKIIAVTGLIVVAFFALKHVMEKGTGVVRKEVTLRYQVRPGTRTITVSADRESEPVYGVDSKGNPYHIAPSILSDTTPYIMKHNGGEAAGGRNQFFEARKYRTKDPQKIAEEKARWKGFKTSYATFQLPPGYQPVQLQVTVTQHKQGICKCKWPTPSIRISS